MAKPFDVTTKALVDFNPVDWLRFLHLPGDVAESIDANLATVTTEADRVVRVLSPDPYLAHFEFQASRDDTLLTRSLRYNVLLDAEYGLPVKTVLLLLRPEAESPGMTGILRRTDVAGRVYLTFEYDVVRLWEVPVEEILNGGLATLPLAPLANVSRDTLPEIVRRMESCLQAGVSSDEVKRVWASTYILMGLKYSSVFTAQLLRGVQQMKESVTYQAILAEGRDAGLALGIEQGKKQGLEQGLERGVRATILRMGAKRFGPVPADVLNSLDAIHSFERLETLAERLLAIESWAELLSPEDRTAG